MNPAPGWYQLDVGQGDAALLIGDHGTRILIDTGDGRLIERRLDLILPPWDRRIDVVILTHTDADHAGGLVALSAHYSLGELFWTGTASVRPEIHDEIAAMDRRGRARLIPTEVQLIDVDGWELQFLWPNHSLQGLRTPQTNATSIITLGEYHGMQFITSGDAPSQIEQMVLLDRRRSQSESSPVNVMKIGHHGSLTSTSSAWLSIWKPACVVISSGRNNAFGHPHPMILARLSSMFVGEQIQRTDTQHSFWYHHEDGEVVVEALSLSHHRVFDRIKDTISSYFSSWRFSYGNRTNINHPQARCGPTQAGRSDPAGI